MDKIIKSLVKLLVLTLLIMLFLFIIVESIDFSIFKEDFSNIYEPN